MLDQHNKTKLNLTLTFTIEGKKVRFKVTYGVVYIKGKLLPRIAIEKVGKKFHYYSTINNTMIEEYKGLTLRKFVIKLNEEEKITLWFKFNYTKKAWFKSGF